MVGSGYFVAICSTLPPLRIVNVHFDGAGSQSRGVRSGRLSRLRSRCGGTRIFGRGGHFSWQVQGKPLGKVDFS